MGAPILLIHDGKAHNQSEWARILGMSEWTLRNRIKAGWSVRDALETPVGVMAPAKLRKPARQIEPPPPCDVDLDVWMRAVYDDRHRNTSLVFIAYTLVTAIKDGMWPLTVSGLARRYRVHRRTLQRQLPALAHCGFIRMDYVAHDVVHISLIDKSAPAEPALLAAE